MLFRPTNHSLIPPTFPPISFLTLKDYITNLVNLNNGVYWPLDDVANNPYNRVINSAVAVGRNICIDGDMETSGVSKWSANNSATLTKEIVSPHSGTQNLKIARNGVNNPGAFQAILQIGRVYRIQGWFRGDGSAIPRVTGTVSTDGTASTSWQSFDIKAIGSTTSLILTAVTSTGTQFVEFDDVTVTELNIPSSTAVPVQLLNTDVWNGLGTAAWTASASTTISMQTTTRHDGLSGTVIRLTRSSGTIVSAKQTNLTIGLVYRCFGWTRSDGTCLPRITNNAITVAYFTGTISTDWQPFDFIFVADATSVLLQFTTGSGTFVEFDVTVISLDTGIRQGDVTVGADTNMELSGIAHWSVVNLSTITKETASPHSGTQNLRITAGANNSPQATYGFVVLTIGKTYQISGWYRTITTGITTAQILQGGGATFGNSPTLAHSTTSAWLSFSTVGIATAVNFRLGGNPTANGEWVEFDDITVTELSPLVALPVNGVVLGNAESSRLLTSVSFDAVNDAINAYSVQLNGVFDPTKGTMSCFIKMSGVGVWTDGVVRYLVRILNSDSTQQIRIFKAGTNNTLTFEYVAGGVTKTISVGSQSFTGWALLTLTWDMLAGASGELKAYINGVQQGSTQTALGTWSGNIIANGVLIGSASSGGSNVHNGFESHVLIFPSALAIDYIAEMAKLGDVT